MGFQCRLSHITEKDNYELENAGGPYVNTLYSALSRHVLRPNPYAARDLNRQIKEHTTITPRSIRAHCLGNLILESLEKLHHHCPMAITTLLDSLLVLTAGRTPRKKIGQDWMLTKQVAFIPLMYLRGMNREDLVRMGANTMETLKIFVQGHLISHGRRWMKRKAFEAWNAVQES